jgi:hypothetical protein
MSESASEPQHTRRVPANDDPHPDERAYANVVAWRPRRPSAPQDPPPPPDAA